jgi:hypothetical protein
VDITDEALLQEAQMLREVSEDYGKAQSALGKLLKVSAALAADLLESHVDKRTVVDLNSWPEANAFVCQMIDANGPTSRVF